MKNQHVHSDPATQTRSGAYWRWRAVRNFSICIVIIFVVVWFTFRRPPPFVLPAGPVRAYLLLEDLNMNGIPMVDMVYGWRKVAERDVSDPQLTSNFRRIFSRNGFVSARRSERFPPTPPFRHAMALQFGEGDNAVVVVIVRSDEATYIRATKAKTHRLHPDAIAELNGLYWSVFPDAKKIFRADQAIVQKAPISSVLQKRDNSSHGNDDEHNHDIRRQD